jgi:hypothetical protein
VTDRPGRGTTTLRDGEHTLLLTPRPSWPTMMPPVVFRKEHPA